MRSLAYTVVCLLVANIPCAILAQDTVVAQDATQKLIERFEKSIERLEKENETLKVENKRLAAELEALKKSTSNYSGNDKADDAKEKKDLTPLDSLWKGKSGSSQGGKAGPVQTAIGRIIRRGKDDFTITIKLDNGTNCEYDFKFSVRNKFQLVETRLVTDTNGVDTSTAPPVGGVSGTGTCDGKKMSIITQWTGAAGGLLTSRFEFQLSQ